ncbi:hypothetical protein BDW74DRAFT_18302 [Aspergillus multicolor]|uniref:uncharacterized protein n=1 Tax=Aspergillus multicolor TaxID=41759 RepID=UPI003CCCA7FF
MFPYSGREGGWLQGHGYEDEDCMTIVVQDGNARPAQALGALGGRTHSPTQPYPKARFHSERSDSDYAYSALPNSEAGGDADPSSSIPALPYVASDMKQWCERYCSDTSPIKSFTIHRSTLDLNIQTLQTSLTRHIRSLNYRGSIDFDLTTAQTAVTFYSPHWVNRCRVMPWVRWLCGALQLCMVVWPVL